MTGGPGRLAALAALLLLAACTSAPAGGSTASRSAQASPSTSGGTVTAPGPSPTRSADSRELHRSVATTKPRTPTKVLMVMEENSTWSEVLASGRAPYLTELAATYANVVNAQAGYPLGCPSLPSYVLLTSGTTAGICDDQEPSAHPLSQDNVFHQLQVRGREWRAYAESMPEPCALSNSGTYGVRHVPSTYYTDVRAACAASTLPLGDPATGELPRRAAAGTLAPYTLVTPDDCHNMHGNPDCGNASGDVTAADTWLRERLAPVLAGPDFRSGRLVVLVVWDEGSDQSDHVPLLVLQRDLHRVRATTSVTGCSVLRATEEIERLPLLGCARTAPSLLGAVGLTHP